MEERSQEAWMSATHTSREMVDEHDELYQQETRDAKRSNIESELVSIPHKVLRQLGRGCVYGMA